jgi:cellobiose-specific phosphotransferase system component IIA
VATAGIEAVETAREAVDAARAGEPERAEQLLNTAETTRNRCQN